MPLNLSNNGQTMNGVFPIAGDDRTCFNDLICLMLASYGLLFGGIRILFWILVLVWIFQMLFRIRA